MLTYVNHDIVFQEFPDEVTLAINLSRCPNRCPGCHSPYLQQEAGEELTKERLFALMDAYEGEITCIGLMGGDNDPATVCELFNAVRKRNDHKIRTGWYSGARELSPQVAASLSVFDYVKVGPYCADLGPLSSPTTNQRLFQVKHPENSLTDITERMRRK